jgi:hypothetical protein
MDRSSSLSEKPRPDERGQVFIEAILWITLFSVIAIGFLRLSVLDYRAYRKLLRNHESRSGGGSLRLPFSSHSVPTEGAGKKAVSTG